MNGDGHLSRREFLALAGASGLFVLFDLDRLLAQEPARLPGRPGYPADFNAYLRIAGERAHDVLRRQGRNSARAR